MAGMRNRFRSYEEAKRRFDEYVKVEPRLAELWWACRRAAPPIFLDDSVEDPYDVDAYDVDRVSRDPDDWCAEIWFAETIKPRFRALVGWERPSDDLPELRTSKVYDDVYMGLLYFALSLTCKCCRPSDPPRRQYA
jgi:hypothetical protein